MPRVPRIYMEGALYYVTSRSIQGQNLFNDKEDYDMYLELINKNKKFHGFKLFAFALMPSHIHLLVETKPQTSLSDIMHNITSSYTKYYNKKHNRQGHLFRGRFRAVIIEKEPNLLKLTRYIHLNPRSLGLTQGIEYPYSSYLYYTNPAAGGAGRIDLQEEISEVSRYLTDASYDDFMRKYSSEENKSLHKELGRNVFLGSEEFTKSIRERIEQASVRGSQETQEKRNYRLAVPLASGIILAALTGSILLYANRLVKRTGAVAVAPQPKGAPLVVETLPLQVRGLDGTVWQVKFVAGTPFQAIDIITFSDGKMTSENMNLNGYASSNYSSALDKDRLTWETMQTSKAGVALWRGEVEAERMKGVLSLRHKGALPQDFSFVSISYVKK